MIIKRSYLNFGLLFAIATLPLELYSAVLPMLGAHWQVSARAMQLTVSGILCMGMIMEIGVLFLMTQFSLQVIYQALWLVALGSVGIVICCDNYSAFVLGRLLQGMCLGGFFIIIRLHIEKTQSEQPRGFHLAYCVILFFHALMIMLCPILATSIATKFSFTMLHGVLLLSYLGAGVVFYNWQKMRTHTVLSWPEWRSIQRKFFKEKDMVNYIILAGVLGSFNTCEIMFSAFYLIKQYHFSSYQLGSYLSLMQAFNMGVRFTGGQILFFLDRTIMQKIMLFVLGLALCLLSVHAVRLTLNSYIIACLLFSLACNGLMVLYYINLTEILALKFPRIGIAWFGCIQIGVPFILTFIMSFLMHYWLNGFLLMMAGYVLAVYALNTVVCKKLNQLPESSVALGT
jgi:hypothetical protein